MAEIEASRNGGALRPGYVLLGDEMYLYERCRRSVLDALVDPAMRDFALAEIDLAETSIFEVLDRAQTPSLMAPFQVLFLRNVKTSTDAARRRTSLPRSMLTSGRRIRRRC